MDGVELEVRALLNAIAFDIAMRENSCDVDTEGQQSLAGRADSPDGAVQGCGLSR